MRVTSSNLKEEKLNIEDFPDGFEAGKKNCFDCKNFVINFGEFKKANQSGLHKGIMRCKKHALLVEDFRGRRNAEYTREEIREGEYRLYPVRMGNIKNGWRSRDWNFAERCDEFESMVDVVQEGGRGGNKI